MNGNAGHVAVTLTTQRDATGLILCTADHTWVGI
jgi:hypothetical protein